MPRIEHRRQNLVVAGIDVERHHLGARDHDLVRHDVGELEDPLDHLLFALFQKPALLAGGDEHLELVFRVDQTVLPLPVQPDQASSTRSVSQ